MIRTLEHERTDKQTEIRSFQRVHCVGGISHKLFTLNVRLYWILPDKPSIVVSPIWCIPSNPLLDLDAPIQRSARILDPGNSRRESASFFLARPREMIFWSLDLVSKHESNKMESRSRLEIREWSYDNLDLVSPAGQVRARKMILDLVSKNCTFPWGERHLRKRELVAKKLTLTKRLRFPKIGGQCTFYHGWPPRNCMHISEAFQVW